MVTKVITELCVLLVAPALIAQQFAHTRREALPRTTGSALTSLIDLDGDGALDIYLRTNVYLQNDGHGRFTERSLGGQVASAPPWLIVGDFDGDGDQDAAAARTVLHNRGPLGPVWTTSTLVTPIAAGDFDGDQKTDLVTTGGVAMASSLTIFQSIIIGGGSGASTAAAAVADIDGDGDLDVVRASSGGTFQGPFGGPPYTLIGDRFVWRNDGGGTWSIVSPFVGATPINDTVSDIVAFDADGDGDVDCGFVRPGGSEFWRNTGGGSFTAWPGLIGNTGQIDVCDLDRDGDLDLVSWWGSWFENRGLGVFAGHVLPGTQFYLREASLLLHAIGDVNGDLEPDLVYGNMPMSGSSSERRVLLNQGGARDFVDAGVSAWQSALSRPLAIGDVDGDAFPDLVDRSTIGGTLWRNGGDGWFTAAYGPYVPRLVDLDGDGDLDGWTGNYAVPNDGSGAFTYSVYLSFVHPPASQIHEEQCFDADGDGNNDLLFLDATTLVLMRNIGLWTYAGTPPLPLPTVGMEASGIADFDGDGDIDVLVGFTSPLSVGLLRNDGTGAFTLDPAGVVGFAGSSRISNFEIADLDRDGDPDVLVGRFGTNSQHLVLRNANGVLTADPAALPSHSGRAQLTGVGGTLRLGDVDGDGDPDAVVWVDVGYADLHLWHNDGTGHFTLAEDLQFYGTDPILLADVDLDGDADLFAGSRLLLNRQWHFEAPFLPQIGSTYVFRCGGRAMPNALAIPVIGTRAHLPLPGYGTLGIDPQTTIPYGWLFLNGEMAEGTIPIPANPALIGMPASIQAVLVANGEVHLTPAKHEILRS